MGWLLQGIGTGLIVLAIADIYLMVLYPRGDIRRRWNPNIIALAKYMEYDWSAIAPSVVQGVD